MKLPRKTRKLLHRHIHPVLMLPRSREAPTGLLQPTPRRRARRLLNFLARERQAGRMGFEASRALLAIQHQALTRVRPPTPLRRTSEDLLLSLCFEFFIGG